MFDFDEELKNLPEEPGVYLMHDSSDKIIYVGKAKILKNRVRQYFQKNSNHTPKVLAMVSNIAYFEYIFCIYFYTNVYIYIQICTNVHTKLLFLNINSFLLINFYPSIFQK